jgi:hypothetical protein
MQEVPTMVSAAAAPNPRSSAVVWLNHREARVAKQGTSGRPVVAEITRGLEAEGAYLVHVIHEIGDRERVIILGPGSARLALEREYVSLYRRPERLVDVESAEPVTADELSARLRTLAT